MKFQKGQSLIELLVAMAVGTILVGGSAVLMGVSLKSYSGVKKHQQANVLIRESAEVIQSLARSDWHSVYDLIPGIHYKVAKRGNTYVIQKGEEKVLTDEGLVAYWNMDEGSGETIYDSQNINNGTLMNSPTWQSGSDCVNGSCLEFNGSNNYVGLDDFDLDYSEFTVELWTKSYSASQAHVTNLIGKGNWNQTNNWYIGYKSATSLSFVYGVGWTQGPSYPIDSFDLTQWHHITGVATTDKLELYLDGVLVDFKILSHGPVSNDYELQIARSSYYGEYFDGLIDEVRVYNHALSVEEVQEHYKAGLDKLGLVGYWSMDENGGTIAYDNANSNHGTLINNPTWRSSSNCVSGSCLNFTDTQYVNCGDDVSLKPISSVTVEAWAKPVAFATVNHIFTNSTTVNNNGYGLFWYQNAMRFAIYNYANYKATFPFPSADDKWHHIVGTYDKSTERISIYVDGVKGTDGSYSSDIVYTTGLATIGRCGSYNGYFWNGSIDEVRVYNRALTAEEIGNRYQSGYTRYLTFNKVSRTSGNIDNVYSSANDDSSTLKIISTIKYGSGLVSEQTGGVFSVSSYLTRSENNKTFYQTDWSGGNGQTGPISNSGNKFYSSDNINYASTTGSIYMETATTTPAELVSSILDTGVSGGAGFNSLLWKGALNTGGSAKFQIAYSNSSSGPWTYYGPTSTSDYYQPNPNVSIAFPTAGSASPQNMRYIRYKVYLSTDDISPTINDIIINWSP